MIPQDMFDPNVLIRSKQFCRYWITADFAGEHSSPYGTPFECLRINRSVPKVILSVVRADGYKICTGGTVIKMFSRCWFSFRQILFAIHFHHPYHYNTNRQRKQSLCRIFVSAISPLRIQRERSVLFLYRGINKVKRTEQLLGPF